MSYITYEVRVYRSGYTHWYLNGKRHREDGPAIERQPGGNSWYLNDVWLTEETWKAELERRNNPDSCVDKIVEFEGKKYKLTPV